MMKHSFFHRYHLVSLTKCPHKALLCDVRLRVYVIILQVRGENTVDITRGVLSNYHVHMFVSVPVKQAISNLMHLMKGRSSHNLQRDFPHLKERYRGCHFWDTGYFSTANGAINEHLVIQYLENHIQHLIDASR